MGEMDDKDYQNGTSEWETALSDGENETGLTLVHNSKKPSLDDLSFVLEGVSGMEECDLPPAFKSLAKKCKGKGIGWERSQGVNQLTIDLINWTGFFTSDSSGFRLRELTGKEKSKAQERKQLLAASLEAKKRELNGTSDESGEFRLLVDKVSNGTIFEAIGIQSTLFSNDGIASGILLETFNREGTPKEAKKVMVMKKVPKSFAVENILEANKEKDCKRSQLKQWISYCFLADLRPLTKDERSQLDELNGEAIDAIDGLIAVIIWIFLLISVFILNRLDLTNGKLFSYEFQ